MTSDDDNEIYDESGHKLHGYDFMKEGDWEASARATVERHKANPNKHWLIRLSPPLATVEEIRIDAGMTHAPIIEKLQVAPGGSSLGLKTMDICRILMEEFFVLKDYMISKLYRSVLAGIVVEMGTANVPYLIDDQVQLIQYLERKEEMKRRLYKSKHQKGLKTDDVKGRAGSLETQAIMESTFGVEMEMLVAPFLSNSEAKARFDKKEFSTNPEATRSMRAKENQTLRETFAEYLGKQGIAAHLTRRNRSKWIIDRDRTIQDKKNGKYLPYYRVELISSILSVENP
ncbi:MAG: hypothetical protein M1834_003078 [Cirrosporium novae-zelandiae]|nr:MAG: hypothetical protein M1834_003078 [Cirrosporium novae-zelandiae]